MGLYVTVNCINFSKVSVYAKRMPDLKILGKMMHVRHTKEQGLKWGAKRSSG